MPLIDTNVFLEIMLNQDKKELCKNFIQENEDSYITDFSYHSIGLILFYRGKEKEFLKFSEDILKNVEILSLPKERIKCLIEAKENLKLDFDDAYQYCTAKIYGLSIVTMDRDFERVKDIKIIFL